MNRSRQNALVSQYARNVSTRMEALEGNVREAVFRYFPAAARFAIFLVYTWFGAVKFTGLSGATPLAEALTEQTIGPDHFRVAFLALAAFECVIGVLFLIPAAIRVAIPLLVIHLMIVCSPLVLVWRLAWTAPLVPTLEGQYIIKNVVIVTLVLGIAARTAATMPRRPRSLDADNAASSVIPNPRELDPSHT